MEMETPKCNFGAKFRIQIVTMKLPPNSKLPAATT